MSLATFRISADPGRASITVNGEEIGQHVRAYQVRHGVDEIPVLTIEAFAGGTIEGEGIVEVQRSTGDLAAVAAWIRGLDADALRSQAANRTGLGGNTTQALLDLIAEMLDGGAT